MRWYRQHGRHALPWRLTRDPYAVLVSEVMLQQTRVEHVLPYFERWLARWPTVRDLAQAPVSEVIRAWGGMGYNRRSVFLHRAAAAIVQRPGGALPNDPRALMQLPGVGPYTAAAVASFAFGIPLAVVDTNVRRVVARAAAGAANTKLVPARQIREKAAAVLPPRNVRQHNLALMDLGATVCTARAPKCGACPLRLTCKWLAAGKPEHAGAAHPAEPFERTSRFARGRIVDLLRTSGPLGQDEISRTLPPGHQDRTETYLVGLERDGLVARRGCQWDLPGVTAR